MEEKIDLDYNIITDMLYKLYLEKNRRKESELKIMLDKWNEATSGKDVIFLIK